MTIGEIIKERAQGSADLTPDWYANELNSELSKYFSDFETISYQDIIADTYYLQKNSDFDYFQNN